MFSIILIYWISQCVTYGYQEFFRFQHTVLFLMLLDKYCICSIPIYSKLLLFVSIVNPFLRPGIQNEVDYLTQKSFVLVKMTPKNNLPLLIFDLYFYGFFLFIFLLNKTSS